MSSNRTSNAANGVVRMSGGPIPNPAGRAVTAIFVNPDYSAGKEKQAMRQIRLRNPRLGMRAKNPGERQTNMSKSRETWIKSAISQTADGPGRPKSLAEHARKAYAYATKRGKYPAKGNFAIPSLTEITKAIRESGRYKRLEYCYLDAERIKAGKDPYDVWNKNRKKAAKAKKVAAAEGAEVAPGAGAKAGKKDKPAKKDKKTGPKKDKPAKKDKKTGPKPAGGEVAVEQAAPTPKKKTTKKGKGKGAGKKAQKGGVAKKAKKETQAVTKPAAAPKPAKPRKPRAAAPAPKKKTKKERALVLREGAKGVKPAARAKYMSRLEKAGAITGSGKGGKILVQDIERAVYDGRLNEAAIRRVCDIAEGAESPAAYNTPAMMRIAARNAASSDRFAAARQKRHDEANAARIAAGKPTIEEENAAKGKGKGKKGKGKGNVQQSKAQEAVNIVDQVAKSVAEIQKILMGKGLLTAPPQAKEEIREILVQKTNEDFELKQLVVQIAGIKQISPRLYTALKGAVLDMFNPEDPEGHARAVSVLREVGFNPDKVYELYQTNRFPNPRGKRHRNPSSKAMAALRARAIEKSQELLQRYNNPKRGKKRHNNPSCGARKKNPEGLVDMGAASLDWGKLAMNAVTGLGGFVVPGLITWGLSKLYTNNGIIGSIGNPIANLFSMDVAAVGRRAAIGQTIVDGLLLAASALVRFYTPIGQNKMVKDNFLSFFIGQMLRGFVDLMNAIMPANQNVRVILSLPATVSGYGRTDWTGALHGYGRSDGWTGALRGYYMYDATTGGYYLYDPTTGVYYRQGKGGMGKYFNYNPTTGKYYNYDATTGKYYNYDATTGKYYNYDATGTAAPGQQAVPDSRANPFANWGQLM